MEIGTRVKNFVDEIFNSKTALHALADARFLLPYPLVFIVAEV